ncbi:enoyl-CoA hydratase-related protein [Comamonadaceae bacterium G21597-S1]|nr:enoyl-CoA hydratase-related protein [Comamonadaceae bacterium G21597-S1]
MAEFVQRENRGPVSIVTICRPERRNALNLQLKQEIVDHLRAAQQDPAVAAIVPGAGGTQRMLRAAGRYKTLLWSLTGDMIAAPVAFASNMVSELVATGAALERAIAIASRIATMPPLAVQAIREAVRLGGDTPLDTALALERRLFERLFDTQDQQEGMRAFLEKRPPHYSGR